MPYVFNPFTGTFDVVPTVPASAPAVPLSIASGVTFTVAANTQVLYSVEIDNDGEVYIDGEMVKV